MKKPKIICIGGPTAVGKTALAIDLAKRFNGEIISCDSIAIYKDLNIGSAKPTIEEQKEAKHYMIDIKSPNEEYSAAEYKADAEKIIQGILQRNKLPIIVGGTGLYMKTLLFPLDLGHSEKSDKLREKYKAIAIEKGNLYLLEELKKVDSESAEKLHEKDLHRIIRALEIYELTGKKKSSYKTELVSKYDYKLIFLNDDRTSLYNRIDERVDKMINEGLETEVKKLIKNYKLTRDNQSMCGIGYKEFFDYFDKKCTFDELINSIKLDSHHYAKRQVTWFKKMPKVEEYNYTQKDKIIDDVKNFLM